jgi:hypothetical protein
MDKKEWQKPEVRKIKAGSAENGSLTGSDGCCGGANNKAS